MRPAPLQLPRRSRSRSTWSASSASRARAPSTTCGGAFEVKASFDSLCPSRLEEALGLGQLLLQPGTVGIGRSAPVPGRADQRLDLAGDDREAALRHRPVERVARQVALERAGMSESLDRGPERLERGPERLGHGDPHRQPAGRPDTRLGAGVAQPADELDERVDLGLRREVALPHSRPSGDDQQLRVRGAVR